MNRGASSTKPVDGASGAAGLDTMAEDLDQLKYDVGELKDLLGRPAALEATDEDEIAT